MCVCLFPLSPLVVLISNYFEALHFNLNNLYKIQSYLGRPQKKQNNSTNGQAIKTNPPPPFGKLALEQSSHRTFFGGQIIGPTLFGPTL